MKIWAVISQKGGAGKTTIALHLAVSAANDGRSIVVLDLDAQQSAVRWSRIRESDKPRISGVILPDLARTLASAKKEGVDYVIIDTSPRADSDSIEVAKQADMIIVPVRPSFLDLAAVDETMQVIKAAKQEDKTILVLNAVAPRTTEAKDAADFLKGLGTVLREQLGERADYRRALLKGQGVTEFAPKSAAAKELAKFYKALQKHAKKISAS